MLIRQVHSVKSKNLERAMEFVSRYDHFILILMNEWNNDVKISLMEEASATLTIHLGLSPIPSTQLKFSLYSDLDWMCSKYVLLDLPRGLSSVNLVFGMVKRTTIKEVMIARRKLRFLVN